MEKTDSTTNVENEVPVDIVKKEADDLIGENCSITLVESDDEEEEKEYTVKKDFDI